MYTVTENSTVNTPFGIFKTHQVSRLITLGVLKEGTGEYLIPCQHLEYVKETKDGPIKFSRSLPFKFYNFEYWFKKTGDFEEAIAKTTLEFLPNRLDFTSYAGLMQSLEDVEVI